MNDLDRVQGCNRIIVQGHREIEDQLMEGRGFQSTGPGKGGEMKEVRHTAPKILGTLLSLNVRACEESLE